MSYTHEQIEQAIAEWQKRLRMQDWEFRVGWDEEPEGEYALASIEQVDGRRLALIRFCREHIESAAPADLSLTIAHELLHMVLVPLDNAVDLALNGASNERVLLVRRQAHYANEIVTDSLAAAFCRAYGPPYCLLDDTLRVTE